MPRLVFFAENNWVFGKIFNELVKHLLPEYDCDIYDWGRYMSPDESAYFNAKYDLFFSTPVGCFFLHDQYGTPLEQCYAHAHSEFDIDNALQRFPREYFDRLGGYGVVSSMILTKSRREQIARIPEMLHVGVTVANYRREPADQFTTLGYFGRMARVDDIDDIKRGYLAQQVAEQTGMTLLNHEHVPFCLVDQAYHRVDAVLFCSLTEGNPYMALEALAAGIPVLGTAVGRFPELVQTGGGVVLPTPAEEFVKHAAAFLHALRRDRELYLAICARARTVGDSLDWKNLKPTWLEALRAVAEPRRVVYREKEMA